MPCYGQDERYFDLEKTKSAAGVLSECFRKYPGTIRSCFPKFSMCGYGKYAECILSKHSSSIYQFDEYSPYSIAVKNYNAKVLLVGMGKENHKISVFHCASYASKDSVDYYKKCYSQKKSACVISDNKQYCVDYIDRMPGYNNNKRVFRKLFKKTPKKFVNKDRLKLTLFNSKDAYDIAWEFCKNGGRIYK